jgi:hypothetical protein
VLEGGAAGEHALEGVHARHGDVLQYHFQAREESRSAAGASSRKRDFYY